MKVEVNVEKKYAFMILGSIIILAGIIGTYAYGTSTPRVFGHSAGEISGLPSGEGGGALTCRVAVGTSYNDYDSTYVDCNAGEIAVGGGCAEKNAVPQDPDLDAYAQWPSTGEGEFPADGATPTGWACDTNDGRSNREAYAVCCSGSGGSSGGGVEVAQAFKKNQDGNIIVVQGDASAFIDLTTSSTVAHGDSHFTGTDSGGIECAPGWKVAGCWGAQYNSHDLDIIATENGCATNDGNDIDLSITCIRATSGGSSGSGGSCVYAESQVGDNGVMYEVSLGGVCLGNHGCEIRFWSSQDATGNFQELRPTGFYKQNSNGYWAFDDDESRPSTGTNGDSVSTSLIGGLPSTTGTIDCKLLDDDASIGETSANSLVLFDSSSYGCHVSICSAG